MWFALSGASLIPFGTFIRAIHGAHPSGGSAVQIGSPADLSPAQREKGKLRRDFRCGGFDGIRKLVRQALHDRIVRRFDRHAHERLRTGRPEHDAPLPFELAAHAL